MGRGRGGTSEHPVADLLPELSVVCKCLNNVEALIDGRLVDKGLLQPHLQGSKDLRAPDAGGLGGEEVAQERAAGWMERWGGGTRASCGGGRESGGRGDAEGTGRRDKTR